MTVEYNKYVTTSRGLGNLGRLLRKWKGSVFKLVYVDVIIFIILYVAVLLIYRFYFVHNSTQKRVFESLVKYCGDHPTDFHMTLLLGFYISVVAERWWSQFMACPWPDSLCILIATHLQGGMRSRLMRRTIMRYVNLSFVLTMVRLSPQAEKRFPTMDDIVAAGLMMPHEKEIIGVLKKDNVLNDEKYIMTIPLVWAGYIIQRAKRENRISDPRAMEKIIREIVKFQSGVSRLIDYQRVNIPLHYSQLAIIVLYLHFLVALFGKQFLVSERDLYFPIFLFVEFFVFMGWFRVAECMLCPWGDDDDDFEVNWLIDRNVQVSYIIVDGMHDECPEMLKDTYWDDIVPEELPYCDAAKKYKKAEQFQGSAEGVKVDPEAELHMENPSHEPGFKEPSLFYKASMSSLNILEQPKVLGGKQDGDVALMGEIKYDSLNIEPVEKHTASTRELTDKKKSKALTDSLPGGSTGHDNTSVTSHNSIIIKETYKMYMEMSYVPIELDKDEQKTSNEDALNPPK